MEMKRQQYVGSGEFRNDSGGSGSGIYPTSGVPPGYNQGQFGQTYQPNYNAYIPQNRTPMPYRTQQDPREVYAKRKEGLTRLRNVGIINIALAVVTSAVGVAMLVVASPNIGFPVFNFGVLLVGILHLVVGILCFLAGKNGLDAIVETSTEIPNSVKGYICGQFGVSVALITFAILASVFAFLSGAVCAGADIPFRSSNNGHVTELNVQQYCEPNKSANSILAFVGGSLCLLIAIISIYGSIWVCCYGTLFGWKRIGHGRIVYA